VSYVPDFQEYQDQAAETAVYPKPIGLAYVALGLAGEAGEIANKVKKVYRDNGGKLLPEVRATLVKEVGDALWYVSALATELGVDLQDVAAANLAKLQDRKERDVLKGSGDNR